MAMENKRIIQLNTERTTPAADDYVMVDSATAGTAKYLLPKITDAINQENSDRASADTALQTAITNEATARTNADTTLQGNITAEATARAEADTAINGEITQLKEDLTAEETARANAVSAEATARELADDAIQAELATKADADGTIASAEQLLSEKYTTDQVPYTFRASGGDGADREYDEIVGGSIVWNQLERFNRAGTTQAGVTCSNVNGVTYLSGTATANSFFAPSNTETSTPVVAGHKYMAITDIKNASTDRLCVGIYGSSGLRYLPGGQSLIWNSDTSDGVIQMGYRWASGTVLDETVKGFLVDLTIMFGSTIADYIYNLEQATAGAGVAWFKKLFPNDYYAYDAGTMMHVSGLSSHDMVGFNQWDEEWELGWINESGNNISASDIIRSKNYTPVFPNTQYFFNYPYAGTINYYDANKTCLGQNDKNNLRDVSSGGAIRTTPDNCRYVRIWVRNQTTYNHDICINLSWDGERDGEYEPYVKHSYPLDDSLTLRGIPKLDANNQLYYDGDIYSADGTVTRKYGIVDLGTLSWNYSNGGYFYSSIGIKAVGNHNLICSRYPTTTGQSVDEMSDKQLKGHGTNTAIYIKDSNYSTGAELKSSLSGVMCVFGLATPTTETVTPFTNPQVCDPYGTEEYVTTSLVPVGHYTKYPANLRSAIERVMEQIPEAPSANGTYTLKATRTSSGVTYAWTAE